MQKKLYVGSTSGSRKRLLEQAKIPFEMVGHTADEDSIKRNLPFPDDALAIAQLKMEHVVLPEGKEGDVAFVLTADTMCQDAGGKVHGKPKSREDAIAKIKGMKEAGATATGFCVHKKVFRNGAWQTEQKVEKVVSARHKFVIPDHWINRYLECSFGMKGAGAIAIECYGEQFLEWVDGSYTTIMGLPMFELREALEAVGFY